MIDTLLQSYDLLWMSVPFLFGISTSDEQQQATSTQTSTSSERQGFTSAARGATAAFAEPEFETFTIPYLESQILGKPIYGDDGKIVGYAPPVSLPPISTGGQTSGLYQGQVDALDALNAMAFGRLGTTPTDLTALRTAQLSNVAPTLFDLTGAQTLKQQTIPLDIQHGAIEDLVSALNVASGLLGSSSRSSTTGNALGTSSASRYGFSLSGASTALDDIDALMQAAGY